MISVIVPVYKVEAYIRECIDSILAQTYTDYELILVDDGSPDRSGEICDAYAFEDDRVRVIHKQNGGLSSARNAGLDICTGEYVTFVDSDDMIHPQMLELLISAVKDTDAGLAVCGMSRDRETVFDQFAVGPSHAVVIDWEEACWRLCGYTTKDSKEQLSNETWVPYIISCAKLYAKELLLKNRFPEGKKHEDEFVAHHYYYDAKKPQLLSLSCIITEKTHRAL